MLIGSIFLRQLRGNLGQCLVGSQTDADWQAYLALYTLMKVLAPCLQLIQLYAIEIHKAFINRVAEIGWCLLTDDAHYTSCQFSIQFIVRGEYGNLLPRELLRQLKVRRTLLDAHLFSLVGTCYNTAVVIRQ